MSKWSSHGLCSKSSTQWELGYKGNDDSSQPNNKWLKAPCLWVLVYAGNVSWQFSQEKQLGHNPTLVLSIYSVWLPFSHCFNYSCVEFYIWLHVLILKTLFLGIPYCCRELELNMLHTQEKWNKNKSSTCFPFKSIYYFFLTKEINTF